jgi:hypothetical protein
VIVPKCNIDKGTVEMDVKTLKVNVRWCEWEMQLIYRGNNYMPFLNKYLKGM